MGVLVMKLMLVLSHAMFICCLSSSSSMQDLSQPLSNKLKGNESDRQALLAIKAQIQHDPNQVTSSWNESLHFCTWQGVTCSARHRQRVTILKLESLALEGSISPHIGNLSFLRVLSLWNNSFTHQIPPQIGHLRRLRVLVLAMNSLGGTIPVNISSCFKLITLRLGKNNLVGQIPPQLSSLSNLQNLNILLNNLTGEIPPSLGNLTSLDVFNLGFNNIRGSIPTSLCQLKRLGYFLLGINRLSGIIPSCIYNLSGIVDFEGHGNQIEGSLPSDLSNAFPDVQTFSVSENQLTGAIPWSISNATNLVTFQCSGNNFIGNVPNVQNLHNLERFFGDDNNLGSGKEGDLSFVSELVNATQLTHLIFGNNNFGGTSPTSISNLSTSLQMLALHNNLIHGSISTGLGNLVNLQLLDMGGNSFTGTIPNEIGKLSRLGVMYLDGTKLSGSIPPSLGNLTLLTLLYLYRNNLNGSIPFSLGECHSLLELDLSQNNLDGKIPQQLLTGLVSLSISLNLSTNHFTGSLPMEIGKLKNLGRLDVSNNLLSGKLPSSLGSCESLEFLYLQGNFFKGLIPSSMKELRGIRDLDLSRNNFSGEIPQFFEDLGSLEKLNLSFNQFSGAVPTGGIFKNATAITVAGNSRLCGGIANLRFPQCKSKGRGLSRRMKIVIPLVLGFALLGYAIVLGFLLHKKKRKASRESSISGFSMLQVSYATLRTATNGFSSANLIGVGAFGDVYKGMLAEDNVTVAVKVFNMLHQRALKSFMAECEALRNIRHRNLVKIVTACSSVDFLGNDFKALVYEFMENGSLEEWLHPSTGTEEAIDANKTLSLVQRLDVAIDVACALDYLHSHCEAPIVHCDLKPSNVLLDNELTGHVSDFGLARFLPEPTANISGNQSSTIGIRGSVGYVAPEYGMGSEVSIYGDVYSFGILLLEIFTGKRPTDPMFSDSLTLHNFVKTALPERVADIADSQLRQENITGVVNRAPNRSSVRAHKVEESLTLIFEIGIACSTELPTNRKEMSEVVSELHGIRNCLRG